MPTLFSSTKKKSDVVAPSHTTTDPFTSSDYITTNKPCMLTQMHVVVPSGETVDISHASAAGNVSLMYAAAPSGTYFLGERVLLHPGEAIRFTTNSVVTGTREVAVKAIQVGEG